MYWFWKPLVWRVYVYLHSVTRKCSCASAFLCVIWKWLINSDEKTIFITLHTRFPNWDYWKHSLKRTLKNRFQISKKRKLAPIAQVFKKKKPLKIKGYWQVHSNNFTSWKIFLYLFADMKISVLNKR